MRKLMLNAFGMAFLCSGAMVMAQDEKPAETQPERPRFNREEFLQKYDKNKDGTIDEEERAAARADFEQNRPEGQRGEGQPGDRRGPGQGRPGEGRGPGQFGQGPNREEMLKLYDKNGNGEIDGDEREAMMAAFTKQREEREAEFKKTFDKDADGKLNAEEEAAYNKAVEERRSRFGNRGQGRPGEGRGPGQFGQGPNREEMLKLYDKNGNGEIDGDEREAMMAAFTKQREEREAEFKKTFDKDADGKLNAEEEAAYNKAVEERRSRFGNGNRGQGRPGEGRPGREQRPQRPETN